MQPPPIHATCISVGGHAVLIQGASGSGKSDLALRLIDRGAILVSDDYTLIKRRADRLFASAPATIVGKLEVRGLGIIAVPYADEAAIALHICLGENVERFPMTKKTRKFEGIDVASVHIAAHEASAPIKVEMALKQVLETP
ncbi:MAG: HPr kinase/phosphatase C-terminal domain-containing protein [Chakrabartia sp.]